jgi:hypothetical protein
MLYGGLLWFWFEFYCLKFMFRLVDANFTCSILFGPRFVLLAEFPLTHGSLIPLCAFSLFHKAIHLNLHSLGHFIHWLSKLGSLFTTWADLHTLVCFIYCLGAWENLHPLVCFIHWLGEFTSPGHFIHCMGDFIHLPSHFSLVGHFHFIVATFVRWCCEWVEL